MNHSWLAAGYAFMHARNLLNTTHTPVQSCRACEYPRNEYTPENSEKYATQQQENNREKQN
jgi:hypothetical protein